MDTKKLNAWADLLLDTGKRNTLINFKDLRLGTVEVISPDITTLFQRADHSATFEVFDPKLEEQEGDFLFDGSDDKTDAERERTKAEYKKAYEKKLKKQQILVYNSIDKPIQALKNIRKRAKSAIEETGVNIAFLAFGFIHWTENDNAQVTMKAPILLAPITIENESIAAPYYIKFTDDDIIVNPTFAFKLQNDYGIKLPEYDEDEDVKTYFERIKNLLIRLKWTISMESKIGIFSFLKINMYQDIKDNSEKIVANKCVQALLGSGDALSGLTGGETGKSIDLLALHNVVDADSSQAEAIEMAKSGNSFVLQGPPGTGKSQTITNIIAECLCDGKKVLFVSEKLAALNVVYDKLKRAGLEEFCLELHSYKSNKKQVIAELCHTLKLQKSGLSDKAEKELYIKKEAQKQLDDYATELHKSRPVIDSTLYRLYEKAAACRMAPNIYFAIKNIKTKGDAYIESAEKYLTRYAEYSTSIGYDYHNNFWFGYKNLDSSYQSVMQLKSDFEAVIDFYRALQSVGETLHNKYNIKLDSLNHAIAFKKFFNLAKESGFITPPLLNQTITNKALETTIKMQALANEILEIKALLDKDFDEDFYKLDARVLYKSMVKFSNVVTRMFSGEYKKIISNIRNCKKDVKKPKFKVAVEKLHKLRMFQKKTLEFVTLQENFQNVFGVDYKGINTDFNRLLVEIRELIKLFSDGVVFANLSKMEYKSFVDEHAAFINIATRLNTAFSENGDAETRLSSYFDQSEYDTRNAPLTAIIAKFEGCYDNIDKIDNWCDFYKLLQKANSLELGDFIDYTINNKIPTAQIVTAFKKAFYMQWIDEILHDSPILLSLVRIPHDEAVKRFKEKDELNFEINKAKIKAKLSAERPNLDMIAQGSSIAILLREGEKKRKQKGVRQLLSEIGDIAQTLKPCFLMSPLSVSTFLNSDTKFDLIIFDEASQIFPQDAIGAIFRGKQLIVVGDSKQMPPSNFFNPSFSAVEDENDDITDFESILDLCSTSFPQRRLKWHYRSRFEQLISFSNNNFYENDLITFPSSKTDVVGVGVDYYYVDGVFDRVSKTNRIEAELIVDLVFENFAKYPERSLGVVAFSISQQDLIDRLISKRRLKDQSKDSFFTPDKDEPFFVKNLETVQGDERDTIIFSIAYAKDSQGKLLLNFGPINREGGERRLNVAVTRAKYNVQLVSSMRYSDIDLSRTNSVGARLLREYLDYAQNGVLAPAHSAGENSFEATNSEFEMEVCEFLREKGFEVEMQVGCSSFKIGLATREPNSSNYLLAIEFDGASYYSSKTARDRDRLRQSILENMGWKFYRIWSTDWFRNKRIEQERLFAAAKSALENAPKKPLVSVGEVSFEEKVEVAHFEFPKYQMADEVTIGENANYDIPRVVQTILMIESPLAEEWLLKRISFMFGGREKVTNIVRTEYENAMQNCDKLDILRKDGFLYQLGIKIPMLRVPDDNAAPRDIKYIAIEELALGITEMLKQNVSCEKSGLFKLLAAQLGFARMGDAISTRMEIALNSLSNVLDINGEILSLK